MGGLHTERAGQAALAAARERAGEAVRTQHEAPLRTKPTPGLASGASSPPAGGPAPR